MGTWLMPVFQIFGSQHEFVFSQNFKMLLPPFVFTTVSHWYTS